MIHLAFRTAVVATALGASALLFAGTALADASSLRLPETGYNYGDIEDSRGMAFDGALRAMGNGISAVLSNPANMALSRGAQIGAFAALWPEAKRQSYGGAAMDSSTSHLAAGAVYQWTDQDPSGIGRRLNDARLALAYPLSDKLAIGLTGRYLNVHQNGIGPLGTSLVSGGLPNSTILNGFSFDAGLGIRPTENVGIGIVGTNLTNPGNGYQPTTVGGGLGVGNQDFVVEGDFVADFTTWQHTTYRAMGGVEYLAGDHFPLRLGYRYDTGGLKNQMISAGFGYIDTQFSVELSARRIIVGDTATAVMLTIQYFIDASHEPGID